MPSPYGFDLVENCVLCKLRSDKFFCNLPMSALRTLDRITQAATYPKGAVLFTEGQAPRGVFILCRGRVKMLINSRDGHSLILKLARPGEVLGVNATILNKPYEATAETLYACQLDFVRSDDFLRFLKEHGDAVFRAVQHVGQYCESAYDQLRSLGLMHSVQAKLAKLLLDLAAEGPYAGTDKAVNIGLCHEEMAQLLGTSRESVARALSALRKDKIAEIRGAQLRILNPGALADMVLS